VRVPGVVGVVVAVIEKMDWGAGYTTGARQTAEAVARCQEARNTNDRNDSLKIILGP
jgi:hypothetical protein